MRVDEFEDVGFFWLPDDVDASHRVPGTLRVSKLGTVTLDTFGLADTSKNSLASFGEHNTESSAGRVLGVTKGHGNVTLEGTRKISRGLDIRGSGTSFSTSDIRASWLFIGRHFDVKEPIRLAGLSFTVEGLDQWLARSGIRAHFHSDRRHATIDFQAPEDLSYSFEDGTTAEILTSYSLPHANRETTEIKMSQSAHIRLATKGCWSLADVANRLAWFRDLLCLAIDRDVSVTSVRGYCDVHTNVPIKQGESQVPVSMIYEAVNQRDSNPDVFGPMMLFQFDAIEPDFERYLERWLRFNADHPAPIRLFFEAYGLSSDMPLALQFQRLVEALEAFDKASGRRAVRLDRRIERMTDPFAENIGLTGGSSRFAQHVSKTRNFLVHHDDSKRTDAAHGRDLFRLTVQCELLLIYHFVSMIAGDQTTAVNLIGKSQPVLRRLDTIAGI
ncbi:MAG: hypothetical protein OXH19_13125 [Chloroflexi bacterium]|nr:hypothetical protein [Chloroflexota bacterium]MCY3587654.1 hypothetical protein [Chloroflexota bacterium]MCY3684553.1 hypothetical protein [Chloroflexota bacterium]MDE2710091.1 hypothetical protein [Chloroflexota bacterium]